MITRTHVAFGGGPLVFVGQNTLWQFKKRTQAFSRKLESLCALVFLNDDDAFFAWAADNGYEPVAVEISKGAALLPMFRFPPRPAIIVGNERSGLSAQFQQRCNAVVTIPQFGSAECLNVAISCAIAIYECNRDQATSKPIERTKFSAG